MSWFDQRAQEQLRVGNYSGEIAQIYAILQLEKSARKALPILSRVAVNVDHIPTEIGIWREQLRHWMAERPVESQNRWGGTYITVIHPAQTLCFWQGGEFFEGMMSADLGLNYVEKRGEDDEYGIHLSFQPDSPPRHHRRANGYPLGYDVIEPDKAVHNLVVKRATLMIEAVFAEVGSTTPLEVFS